MDTVMVWQGQIYSSHITTNAAPYLLRAIKMRFQVYSFHL
jgi:hypothetical protein